MVNTLKKYWPTATFLYLMLFLSITSTWVNEAFELPSAVTRTVAFLVYVPFAACICWKVFVDLKGRFFVKMLREKDIVNIAFYLFAAYYVAITVYRFFAGMEVKENLYYSIVFFGSVALYMLCKNEKLPCSKIALTDNLFAIATAIVAYHALYSVAGYLLFANPTINVNITTGLIAMMFPLLSGDFWRENGSWCKKIYKGVVCSAVLLVILATGSRALFWLTLVSVLALAACVLLKKQQFLKMTAVTLGACLVFGTMLLADVGNVRNSFCRETGISYDVLFHDGMINGATSSPSQGGTEQPSTGNNDKVEEQVASSNYMRGELIKMGLGQISANPWFGTGDVTYEYRLAERTFAQSSHNFLIEGLVCYGIFGMLFVVILFVGILYETKLFSKNVLKNWRSKATILLAMMVYFGFGMVQPTVFDVFMCPVFVLLLLKLKYELADAEESAFSKSLAENVQESEGKECDHVN